MRRRWAVIAGGVFCACSEPTTESMRDPAEAVSWEQVAEESRHALVPCPRLDEAISAEAMRDHLAPLAEVARRSQNNRAFGSGGYEGSVRYVMARLRDAGLEPRRRRFAVSDFHLEGPGVLEITSGVRRTFRGAVRGYRGEYRAFAGSPPGDVTAEVAAAGLGCAAAELDDGAGGSKVMGRIALMQRGSCTFANKVENAMIGGAVGVLIYDGAARGLMGATLGGYPGVDMLTIPALFLAGPAGKEILGRLEAGSVAVHMVADTSSRMEESESVIVDIGGERAETFMLGAHLDSVPEGPGMNDNGSGGAALLAIAEQLHGCKMARTLRFAWWGAEELGLFGSSAYVSTLSGDERASLLAYVNLDMIGAPNHAFQLTDGDGSMTGAPGPARSGELEAFFRADFLRLDIPLLEAPFIGRSDDQPFLEAGVAVAMLGAGYDKTKSAREAALFGGRAGRPHDPCYHRACDDMHNVDLEVMAIITRSVARAVQHFGVEGRGLRDPSATR